MRRKTSGREGRNAFQPWAVGVEAHREGQAAREVYAGRQTVHMREGGGAQVKEQATKGKQGGCDNFAHPAGASGVRTRNLCMH
jgi:hypothetical protein